MASLLYELLNAIEVHQRDRRASLYTGTEKASPLYAFSCVSGEPQTEGLVTQVARKKAFHRCVFLYAFGDLRID